MEDLLTHPGKVKNTEFLTKTMRNKFVRGASSPLKVSVVTLLCKSDVSDNCYH